MRRTTAAKLVLILAAALVAAGVNAQTRHRREREPKETERPAPAVSVDKRDTMVTLPAAFAGKPYWLALAQCGALGSLCAAEVISHFGARPETSLEKLAAKAGLL